MGTLQAIAGLSVAAMVIAGAPFALAQDLPIDRPALGDHHLLNPTPRDQMRAMAPGASATTMDPGHV